MQPASACECGGTEAGSSIHFYKNPNPSLQGPIRITASDLIISPNPISKYHDTGGEASDELWEARSCLIMIQNPSRNRGVSVLKLASSWLYAYVEAKGYVLPAAEDLG